MTDMFVNQSLGLASPLIRGFDVTPSNTVDLPFVTRQLRITGQGGFLAVVWFTGEETVEPVLAGDVLDWRIRRIRATGTTATGIRGYC